MPLRTISAIVLGRGALVRTIHADRRLSGHGDSPAAAIAFAGLFTAAVTRIATATDGDS